MSKNKSLVAKFLLHILHALCEKCILIIFVVKGRFVFAGFLAKIKCDFLKRFTTPLGERVLGFFFLPPTIS